MVVGSIPIMVGSIPMMVGSIPIMVGSIPMMVGSIFRNFIGFRFLLIGLEKFEKVLQIIIDYDDSSTR